MGISGGVVGGTGRIGKITGRVCACKEMRYGWLGVVWRGSPYSLVFLFSPSS